MSNSTHDFKESNLKIIHDIFSNSPIPSIVLKGIDNLINFNNAMEKLTGYSSDEFKNSGNVITKLFSGKNNRDKIIDFIENSNLLKIDSQKSKNDITINKSKIISVNCYLQKIHSGDNSGDYTAIYFLSDNEKSEIKEDSLVESNLLETLLSNIPDLIFFKDKNDRYIRISSSLAKLLGRAPEEILGKSVGEVFSPELASSKFENDLNVIESGNSIIDKEEIQPTSDGGERWLSTTKIPWFDKNGKCIGMFGIARDITKRKNNEKMLEVLKNRYQNLYDNAPVGYQELDKNGFIVQVNKTEAEMLGYKTGELIGKSVFDLIPFEQREKAISRYHTRFDNPDVVGRFERKYICKNGSEIDLYIEDRILLDENGKPSGLLAALQDISDLKKTQDAMLFERNLLETLLNNIPDLIFFKDKEDRYIRISSSLATLLGKSPEEILGKNVSEVFSPEIASSKFENDLNVIESGNSIIDKEEFQPTSDGGERWLSTTKIPWFDKDGKSIGMFGIARDITKRKSYEKMLEKLKDRYQNLYDNAPVGYQELDKNGIIVQVNKTEAEMLGYKNGELIGKSVFDLIPDVQKNKALSRYKKRFNNPDSVGRFERKYLRKDGSEIDLYIEDRIVLDKNGTPTGLLATLQDMSDLKKTQEKLNKTVKAKEHIESELKIAHDIQINMLPRTFPPFPERKEFNLFAILQPAKEVGGDFYDFFFIDEKHLCFCIGDVADKGVPASLYMAVTRTLIKSKTIKGLSPSQVLERVNEDLSIDNETCIFVTIFCGILNVETGDLEYANAGHNPPLISQADGNVDFLKVDKNIAIGINRDAKYVSRTMKLNKNDTLLLYTDGVTEAIDNKKNPFSSSSLKNVFSKNRNEDVNILLQNVLNQIIKFSKNTPQFDDLAMLALRYNGF